MKLKKQIELDVDQTLASLDAVSRVVPEPYFFTRVMARLNKGEKGFWGSALVFLSRPVIAFATIIIAICANAFIYFQSSNDSSKSSTQGEQLFATEYNLSDNTIYDSTTEPE